MPLATTVWLRAWQARDDACPFGGCAGQRGAAARSRPLPCDAHVQRTQEFKPTGWKDVPAPDKMVRPGQRHEEQEPRR